jgi:3-hydroxyisobutyrate dehydrogenase
MAIRRDRDLSRHLIRRRASGGGKKSNRQGAGGMKAKSSGLAKTCRVAVIGLGSMGHGMAQSLVRAGIKVVGYDVNRSAIEGFIAEGGAAAASPKAAAEGADVVLSVVVNAEQTEAVLFGADGCAQAMRPGSVFVSSATMAPAVARRMAARLEAMGPLYLDAPISGGARRAAEGALTVLASGSPAAMAGARPVLAAIATKLFELGDAPGTGAAFKIVNQLLAGVHIAAACEAVAFAAAQDLDLRKVYEVITQSAGNSWMFEDRMSHVLDADYAPKSAVNLFVKDLGIVLDIARAANLPVPVAGTALQMFIMTAAAGMGAEDDSSVARLYGQLMGTRLPESKHVGVDVAGKRRRPAGAKTHRRKP